MATKLVKGLTWGWLWLSVWVTIFCIGSELIPPLASVFLEISVVTGLGVIGAVMATRLIAFAATSVGIISAGMGKSVEERSSKD